MKVEKNTLIFHKIPGRRLCSRSGFLFYRCTRQAQMLYCHCELIRDYLIIQADSMHFKWTIGVNCMTKCLALLYTWIIQKCSWNVQGVSPHAHFSTYKCISTFNVFLNEQWQHDATLLCLATLYKELTSFR